MGSTLTKALPLAAILMVVPQVRGDLEENYGKNDGRSELTVTTEDVTNIVAECFSIQGNGYQWFSTMSYISESLKIRAEKGGKDTYHYLDCIIGGSSGSAFVGLFKEMLRNDHLSTNAKLVTGPLTVNGEVIEKARLYNQNDLFEMSKALRFIAMGTDFTLGELAFFLPRVAGGTLNVIQRNVPGWWKQNMHPYVAQILFAQKAFFMKLLTSDLIQTKVEDVIDEESRIFQDEDKLKSYAEQDGMIYVTDPLLDYTRRSNHDRGYAQRKAIMKTLGKWAREKAHELAEEVYGDSTGTWMGRQFSSIDKDTPLNRMLKDKMPDFYCTMAFAVMFENMDHLKATKEKPDYDDLKPFVACNEKTVKMIINSKQYQEDVKNNVNYIRDYKLVTVETYYQAFDFGVREPTVFIIGSDTLKGNGMEYIYDPVLDHDGKFELEDTGDRAMAIIGGYGTSDQMAAIQSYLVEGIRTGFTEAKFKQVTTYQNLVSKKDKVPNIFARKALSKLVCGKKDSPEYDGKVKATLAKWDAFHNNYARTYVPKFKRINDNDTDGNKIIVTKSVVNWKSTSFLPSNGDGTSHKLINRALKPARLAHDPLGEYNDPFCPGPTDGCYISKGQSISDFTAMDYTTLEHFVQYDFIEDGREEDKRDADDLSYYDLDGRGFIVEEM